MSYQLAIQIAIDGIVCDVVKNNTSIQNSTVLFDSSNVESIKDILKEEFSSNTMYQKEFDEVTLSWFSHKSTLVPSTVFSESTPEDLFKLCYGGNEYDVDYNRISELSIVNIYEIPEWIKRFFVIKYPRVIIQHEGSVIIRKALNENAFKLKVNIVVYKSFFQLVIVKHNELVFYSTFEHQNSDDIIYHLMFVLQQKELINEAGSVELINGNASNNNTLQELIHSYQKVKELQKLNISIVEGYLPKAHLLCV